MNGPAFYPYPHDDDPSQPKDLFSRTEANADLQAEVDSRELLLAKFHAAYDEARIVVQEEMLGLAAMRSLGVRIDRDYLAYPVSDGEIIRDRYYAMDFVPDRQKPYHEPATETVEKIQVCYPTLTGAHEGARAGTDVCLGIYFNTGVMQCYLVNEYGIFAYKNKEELDDVSEDELLPTAEHAKLKCTDPDTRAPQFTAAQLHAMIFEDSRGVLGRAT